MLAHYPDYGLNYKYGGWHLTRTVAIATLHGKTRLYVTVGSFVQHLPGEGRDSRVAERDGPGWVGAGDRGARAAQRGVDESHFVDRRRRAVRDEYRERIIWATARPRILFLSLTAMRDGGGGSERWMAHLLL